VAQARKREAGLINFYEASEKWIYSRNAISGKTGNLPRLLAITRILHPSRAKPAPSSISTAKGR
jgi:hypothetical protein